MLRLGFWACFILGIALGPALVRGADPADVLKEKGLVKHGLFYVVPAEQEVQGSMRDLRTAKRKLEDDAVARKQIEDRLRQVKSIMAGLEHDEQAALQEYQNERNGSRRNSLVARVEQIRSQLKEGEGVKNDLNTRLRALGDNARNDYIAIIVQLGQKVEKANEQYAELAKDDQVKEAMEELNKKPGLRWKLGPSPDFIAATKEIGKLRSDVASATIPIKNEGNVNMVDVVLNGKLTREFVLDSGASLVAIPWDLAEELDITPTDKDQTIRFQQADGKVIDAKLKTLKSVRVGGFAVEDVECAVYPKNLPNTPMLLGGSFLNNFIYRLDPEKGELHLAAIGKSNKRITTDLGDAPGPKNPNQGEGTRPRPRPAAQGGGETTPPVAGGDDHGAPKPPPETMFPKDPSKDPLASANNPKPGITPEERPSPAKNTEPKNSGRSKLDSKRVAEFLEKEYASKLTSRDWRTRGLAVISLARLPQESVTERLQKVMDSDQNDVVRLLAWQAILARVSQLTAQEHTKWMNSTLSLADRGAFRGRLRVPLINAMATAPMNYRSRKVFEKLATDANAWEPFDVPVLKALGRCLGTWKSGQIAEALINAMGNENYAVRAEFILQEAGVSAPTAKSLLPREVFNPLATSRTHPSSQQLWRVAQQGYADWLKRHRSEWREATSIPGEPWKELKPFYIDPPVSMDEIDPNDKSWRSDFELGNTNIKAFEVAFCVDATGSMGEVLNWLSRDLVRMTTALSASSLEPRIGLTFYRDHDDDFVTRVLPLTGDVRPLIQAIAQTGATGGGDIPEAVKEGLAETLAKSKWSNRQDGGKAIVLVGDAPPHPGDVSECVKLAEQARKQGFKFYAVKVTTEFGANDLSSFDEIAKAAGGSTVDCAFPRMSSVRFIDAMQHEIPIQTIARPEAQLLVAPDPPSDDPTFKILVSILADAINPQWKERLGPEVRTLLAWSEPPSRPEERKGFPQDTPPLQTGHLKPQ